MPNNGKQPRKIPTYEDILRDLGPEKMAFMSEMVRPDQNVERPDEGLPATTPDDRAPEVTLDPEHEKAIIEYQEARLGRPLTPQERHLALDQARIL
jgi:hypothetical protein